MVDDELLNLARELGTALKQRGLVLTLAESCTGGGVAQAVTAIPGSSEWFDCGFVTYSNTAKEELLGVNPVTLNDYGAVSVEVAHEMVLGALHHSEADIAAAITGIAGPDGGAIEKPVGTVCFAWATSAGAERELVLHFTGDRQEVRQKAAKAALEGLIQLTLSTDL